MSDEDIRPRGFARLPLRATLWIAPGKSPSAWSWALGCRSARWWGVTNDLIGLSWMYPPVFQVGLWINSTDQQPKGKGGF